MTGERRPTGGVVMSISEQARCFADRFGKHITLGDTTWRYYRLGDGAPIFWLTGGLRRAALGYAFLERLATRHTVIAPDYPPVRTMSAFSAGFDAILRAEGMQSSFALAGQSYGGLLAQAYLAHKGQAVERLILSSTGPADYGKVWLPVEYGVIALVHLLPERAVMNLLTGRLVKLIAVPEAQRAEWIAAVKAVMHDDLSRADVVSHFAVAADAIRQGVVTPAAYRAWKGRVIVLSAEDDPTQRAKDIPRYERLFGRSVEVINMGCMGHTALLFNPDQYVEWFEQALS